MGSGTPTSRFSSLPIAPLDAAFALLAEFDVDPSPEKVSLGVGAYRDDNAKPWILPVVREVELALSQDISINHEYTPITGYPLFVIQCRDLMFGTDTQRDQQQIERIASLQTISGAGANHIGAKFLADWIQPRNVWISDPTWDNHHLIWKMAAPGVQQRLYPYYNADTRSFDFEDMITTLESEAQAGDVVLLHACGHNPTGFDPTKDQWRAIADICQRKDLFPFFDCAYQGFASGQLDEDAWSVRHFFSIPGLEMCVAQSFSKNFGLYGQRVGAFHLVTASPEAKTQSLSQLIALQRSEISTPPVYGARIVATVLSTPVMKKAWQHNIEVMTSRIKSMRKELYAELKRLETPGNWEHIISQVRHFQISTSISDEILTREVGMFAYTGLSKAQVASLKKDFHIYLLDSGRASIAGRTYA